MTSDICELYDLCIKQPEMVFKLISSGEFEVIDRLIEDNQINVNLVDGVGNDVVTRLLKAKQYDLVCKLMKKRNWDVNHKNVNGDTFGHILAHDNSICAVKVVQQLNKKKNYKPNIMNNKGETVLDLALNNNYLCTAIKFIEDKRFNLIDVSTFKELCSNIIKNREYGKYTKINTLEIIIKDFEKKELEPAVRGLVDNLSTNMDIIKNAIMNNNSKLVNSMINSY